jgi:hypothetical protein
MPNVARLSIAGRAALGASFLAAALGLGLLARVAIPAGGGSRWSGFRVLLVDASLPEAEVLAGLSGAGVKGLLSESTEPVLVSDWAGLETRTLADAETRLLPGDPRLDDYLRRLSLWFRASVGGRPYRAIYLKSNSPLDAGNSIAKGLEAFKGRYVLPDAGGEVGSRAINTAFLVCALASILVSCIAAPSKGRGPPSMRGFPLRKPGALAFERLAFRLSLALPWAAIACGGPSAAVIAALWCLATAEAAEGLSIPMEEFRSGCGARKALESLSHQDMPPLALLIVACLALLTEPSLIPAVAISLLGCLVAIPGYISAAACFVPPRRFIPMPIGGRRRLAMRKSTRAGRARAATAFAIVLAWGLFRMLAHASAPISSPDAIFPYPQPAHGNPRPILSEARRDAASEEGDTLPGLASYLEHKAIQEAVPYVRVGELRSDPFASARLPLPPEGAGEGNAAKVAGVDFSDAWARASYRDVPALSIEGMLLSRGASAPGRDGQGDALDGRPLAPIVVLLYIFLLIPLFGRILAGVTFARDAASGEIRQEA